MKKYAWIRQIWMERILVSRKRSDVLYVLDQIKHYMSCTQEITELEYLLTCAKEFQSIALEPRFKFS